MKAVVLEQYGGAESLRYVDMAKPTPGPGQVLIRVYAATVNRSTLKRAAGLLRGIMPELEFPWIPGADISGRVVETGINVDSFHEGDEVYSFVGMGRAYAEYIALDAAAAARKPSTVSHQEAASLALVAQTALQAITESGLQAGQTLLILGAGGAIGNAVIPIAKARGARVLALCRPHSTARLRSLGADEIIRTDAISIQIPPDQVDVVLDGLGGDFEQRGFAALKLGGVFVSLMHPPSQEEAERAQVRAFLLRTRNHAETLEEIGKMMAEGKIKPFIGRTYPLKKAAQAWTDYESGEVEGKIILDISQS